MKLYAVMFSFIYLFLANFLQILCRFNDGGTFFGLSVIGISVFKPVSNFLSHSFGINVGHIVTFLLFTVTSDDPSWGKVFHTH